jgi:diguanylate cyclase (GGDEF)-like protein/PAS domain S-box-containing protein
MKAESKTKAQLVDELANLRERIAELEGEAQQAERNFAERMGRYFPQAETIKEAIYVMFDRKYEFVNHEFAEIFGMTPEEICYPDFDPTRLIAPESRQFVMDKHRQKNSGQLASLQYEFTGLTREGLKIDCETVVLFIPYKWGVAIHGMLRNVTARKRIDEELQRHRNDLQIVLNSIPTSVFYTDLNHRFTQVNKAFCKSLGFSMEHIIGRTLAELFPNLPEDQLSHYFDVNDQVIRSGHSKRGLIEIFPSLRGRRWIQNDRVPYRDEKGTVSGVICLGVDISDLKETEERLLYLSFHDVLTGCYNRAYFDEEITRLEKSRQFPVSIVSIRVDDLVVTNKRHGIEAGNELLRKTAKILRTFRQEDMVARIGGDTFAVLLPLADKTTGENARERIKAVLQEHNRHDRGMALHLSFAVETGEKGCKLADILKKTESGLRQP